MTRQLTLAAAGAVCALMLVSLSGCSRAFYRRQADCDATQLIRQKSYDPRWALEDFTIEMDPRSRFFDPYDRDHPPMPPDDPDSHRLMHRINCMKGYKHWHANGDILELENPPWEQMLPEYVERTADRKFKLRLEDTVRLGLIHSPDYQRQLETLYLSALDVSTERFRFDTQFFGGTDLEFEHLGSERGPGGESNTLTRTTDFEIRRRFATAGELLVGFANSMVWQFAGPDTSFNMSVLNFSFIQPLLRAGGRVVALEQLTIAERGLLANLRAFQRYRQGFYTQMAIGESGVQGPQRRGGFFGGTGLTGFTGQGGAGFGGVGEATGFGRGGFGAGGAGGGGGGAAGFAGGGAGQVGGFIGLLQQLQQIRNTEDSLNAQLRTLALLEAHLEAGLIDIAQVDQFRQNIETERANLLQARNSLTNSLENFVASNLGLPPDMPVELDDSLIRPFQFIDPRVSGTQNAIADFIDRFGDLPREPEVEEIGRFLTQLAELRTRLSAQFDLVQGDLRQFQRGLPARERDLGPAELRQLRAESERLAESLQSLVDRNADTAATLEELKAQLDETTRVETADRLVALAVEMLNLAGELALIQARARLEGIRIEPIKLKPEDAIEIARAHRLDWMNNRAALVDTWRLIEFNANALLSNLDIFFEGDMGTVGDNPFRFRGETGRLRAGVRFDAPFTRLVERNNFRQQLIEYQQSRRQLIQFEDGVYRNLRQVLRDLEQLEVNLQIQRRAVAIAIRRVDQTRETLSKPVPPAAPGQGPAQFGPTAALNLLTALSDLRNSQNNLMSVQLNYHASRMRLMRELGIMRVNEYGLWIDEPLEAALRATAADCPLPPELPAGWEGGLDASGAGPTPGASAADASSTVPAGHGKQDPSHSPRLLKDKGADSGPMLAPPVLQPPASLPKTAGWGPRDRERSQTSAEALPPWRPTGPVVPVRGEKSATLSPAIPSEGHKEGWRAAEHFTPSLRSADATAGPSPESRPESRPDSADRTAGPPREGWHSARPVLPNPTRSSDGWHSRDGSRQNGREDRNDAPPAPAAAPKSGWRPAM